MKFNKWALAFASAVSAFYTAGAAALHFWGEKAICYVEKFHMVKFSSEMMSLDVTPANFAYGLVTHFVCAYLFVVIAFYFHDHIKGK